MVSWIKHELSPINPYISIWPTNCPRCLEDLQCSSELHLHVAIILNIGPAVQPIGIAPVTQGGSATPVPWALRFSLAARWTLYTDLL